MKVIDLLNKIANGEEDDLITEFEFDRRVWNFKGLNDSEFCLDGWLLNQNITITKHKEIIKEEKKIPEKWNDLSFTAMRKEEDSIDYDIQKLKGYIETIMRTQNHVIDYLKSKGDE